jgi:hypothetical protein
MVAKCQYIWLVLDDDYLPIQPIEVFIRYLHHTEKSPDTIQNYASHLKLGSVTYRDELRRLPHSNAKEHPTSP